MPDPIGGFLGGLFHFVGEVFDELFELPRHAARDDEAAFFLGGIVLMLVGSAVGIGWHTWSRSRSERKVSFDVRAWFASAFSMVWLLPVVGVIALLGIRYTDGEPRMRMAPESVSGIDGVGSGEVPVGDTESVPAGRSEIVSEVPSEGAVTTSIPVEPAPWTEVSRVDLEDRTLVTVHSEQFATVDEAEQDALREATELLWEDAKHTDPQVAAAGPLPRELVQQVAVRRRHVEGPIERRTETSTFEVYRVHLQVELSPRVRAEVRPFWRSEIVGRRLWGLAGLAGFLTVAFGTLTAYLRLDDLSAGKYRNRLRFAAASLVTAGGLVAAVLL